MASSLRPRTSQVGASPTRQPGRHRVAGRQYRIARDGDKIFAQATGQPAFQLHAESATTFALKAVDAHVEFAVDAVGNVARLVLAQNARRLPGAKKQ